MKIVIPAIVRVKVTPQDAARARKQLCPSSPRLARQLHVANYNAVMNVHSKSELNRSEDPSL